MVKPLPAVPAAVSKEMLLTVWSATAFATEVRVVLKRAVPDAVGLLPVDQLAPVSQSPPLVPVQVTCAAACRGRASDAITKTAIAEISVVILD